MNMSVKVSRNDPCPCGSGKKYKQCCQNKEASTPSAAHLARLKESIPKLFKQALKNEEIGQIQEAAALYQQILEISPKHIKALHNLGMLAVKLGTPWKGVELLRKTVDLEPSALHYCTLAHCLSHAQQHEEAATCLKKALTLNPGDTSAYTNLGAELLALHRYEEAILYLKKCLTLNPNQDIAIGNLAMCYMRLNRYEEACEAYKHAISINPSFPSHYNNLLFRLCFDRKAFAESYHQFASRLDKLLSRQAAPYTSWPVNKLGPVRVGLVTGDLRNHPVGYFLESVVACLDPAKVELVAYNTTPHEDDMTARLKPFFHEWVNIYTLNDKQAAQQIHNDGIHILMDLAGHTAGNRLAVFAWKPAPIQVSWLGYFASTGLSCMDYFLADPVSVPEMHRAHFSEKIWYLPETRLCFSAPSAEITADVSPLPALKNGYITFGCFQTLNKINMKMLSLWAQILQACPHSKLFFKNHQLKDVAAQEYFLEQCQQAGISVDRLILEEGGTRTHYFSSYHKVDCMLDTFPFPGGTTTCEALWMAVPTVTLGGATLLERQGMAMMSCAGFTDWVAEDEEQYVKIAVSHAHNLPALSQLRAGLRQQFQSSPMMDAPRFAKHFEQALQGMWQQYCHTYD